MTHKQKIEKIIECRNANDYISLLDEIEGISFNLEEKRAYTRIDIRSRVKSFCKENGISFRLFAKAIGYTDDVGYQNFTKYLKGARPLPYEKVEEAISLIGVL